MSLPSCREIRNQVLVLVGTATVVLAATTVITHQPQAVTASAAPMAPSAFEDVLAVTVDSAVNWDDVNLSSGHAAAPEDEVNTARSKMLSDFEAR